MGAIFARHRSRVTQEDKAVLQLKQQRDQLKNYSRRVTVSIEQTVAAAKLLVQRDQKQKALLLLRKKKYEEKLLEQSDKHLTTVEQLISDLEFAQVELKVLDGLKQGSDALKQLNALMKLDDVEKIMSDAQEAIAYQQELSELLSGGLSTLDDADVEKELENLLAADLSHLPLPPSTDLPTSEARERARPASGDPHRTSHHRTEVAAS